MTAIGFLCLDKRAGTTTSHCFLPVPKFFDTLEGPGLEGWVRFLIRVAAVFSIRGPPKLSCVPSANVLFARNAVDSEGGGAP
jgi:hypothetical protein